ncbi:hypothetical protein [Pseudoalteromonas peptidolytica]|uniref:Uncharacterized protein n=1 Tax=Pseudoalteromonas peptidolytica F12-50-A1 TaxID=1315280 RepID=A0A8I0MWT2_9GAMM|nr:hypothetical protein [Pseudoalteromonas peptidolytica]MBE0347364.1 hypothetical protein [Pseudoalteromonas peptidolytica F12-50-A1]NLR13129.1 hypothetical protein [Pseudoalteromonas peptidolytica]GEK11710.1 hypothetical protein PPE03_39590 [Pseudoalteromonas peptidolytica]
MSTLYQVIMENNHLINISIWVVLIISVFLSKDSPNVQWLAVNILFARTLDIALYEPALKLGGWFYFIMATQNLLLMALVIKRKQIANYIAQFNLNFISRFAQKSAKDFSLTPNELTYILILASAALIQTASLIERGFRKLTDFNPMFIYNAYPSLMHILTILSVLVVFSLVIDAYRGFYTRRDSTSRSSSM